MKVILAILLTGCVVPYGEPPRAGGAAPTGASATDLAAVDARIVQLLDENVDVDREARLEAARVLVRQAWSWTPDARQDLLRYLDSVLGVEERFRLEGAVTEPPLLVPVVEEYEETGLSPVVPIEEVTPGMQAVQEPAEVPPGPAEPSGVEPDTAAPPAVPVEDRVQEVRDALAARAYGDAMASLERIPGVATDPGLQALRREAVDGYVWQERERAGRLFLQGKEQPDPGTRREAWLEVRAILAGLVAEYPDSTHADAIRRSLELVEGELSRLP